MSNIFAVRIEQLRQGPPLKHFVEIYQSDGNFWCCMTNPSHDSAPNGLVRLAAAVSLLIGVLLIASPMNAAPESTNVPAKLETATFGGGCFWCAEAIFQRIPGVKSVVSGFAGGTTANPTYEEVCTGATGHAEVVQIKFDPSILTYDKLLEVFWEAHDPTTLNRQGNDSGTQYRSIILYTNDAQKAAAEKSKAEAARHLSAPITTQIVPLAHFYPAEKYHQNYYNEHQSQGYCQFIIRPKLRKLIDAGVVPSDK
jgi:peptide-methionine (S)-S-oxide reductase